MEYKPTITLAFPDNRIRINMSSLRALQYPHYVRLLINPVQKTIALQISDRDDPRCHRIMKKILMSEAVHVDNSFFCSRTGPG